MVPASSFYARTVLDTPPPVGGSPIVNYGLLPCVWCERPLSEAQPVELLRAVQCACGIMYSLPLLKNSNPEQWLYITKMGLSCRVCSMFDTSVTIYTDHVGRPIPCPEHGTREKQKEHADDQAAVEDADPPT